MKIFTVLALAVLATAASASETAPVDYAPRLGGVVRARYEYAPHTDMSRFSVRNARISVSGMIAEPVDYFAQMDMSDRGGMKFLDAWARYSPLPGLKIKGGQFRIPFGCDPFRGPATYYFGNRSFLGRDVANTRSVGLSVAYALPSSPVTVEGGVFNSTPMNDHSTWTSAKAYAAKTTAVFGDFTATASLQSLIPADTRVNVLGTSLTYRRGALLMEAEYMYKHYTADRFRPVHAFNTFANYDIPVKWGVFRTLSLQGRADASTAHSDCRSTLPDGSFAVTTPDRARITLGSTLGYHYRRLAFDFRVNYEKYFYRSHQNLDGQRRDVLLAEVVVAF